MTTFYHGTGTKIQQDTPLHAPLFLTLRYEDAYWFSINRGEEPHMIEGVLQENSKILDLMTDFSKLLEIVDKCDLVIELEPYFYCEEVSQHSEYDGHNSSDIFYIPRVQEYILSMGYHGVKLWDVLESAEIETYILLDTSQFSIQKFYNIEPIGDVHKTEAVNNISTKLKIK